MACPMCGWKTEGDKYCTKTCEVRARRSVRPFRKAHLVIDPNVWQPVDLNREGTPHGHQRRMHGSYW